MSLELDILIAEKVFGHQVVKKTWAKGRMYSHSIGEPEYYDNAGESILSNPLPEYSTDIKEAFEVVEKLRNPKRVFSLVTAVFHSETTKMEWVAKWEMHDPDYRFEFVFSESAAQAICESALKALEENNG